MHLASFSGLQDEDLAVPLLLAGFREKVSQAYVVEVRTALQAYVEIADSCAWEQSEVGQARDQWKVLLSNVGLLDTDCVRSSSAAHFLSQMFHMNADEGLCPIHIVYVCAPANATCADLAAVIRKFFKEAEELHHRVLDRAPEDGGVEDLGSAWLEQMARRECPGHFDFLKALDSGIEMLGDHVSYTEMTWPEFFENGGNRRCFDAVKTLPSLRHQFLHFPLCEAVSAVRETALEKVCVAECTTQGRQKVKCSRSVWGKRLGPRQKELLLIDEGQKLGYFQVGACMNGADACILAADETQNCLRDHSAVQAHRQTDCFTPGKKGSRFPPQPLMYRPSQDWAKELESTFPQLVCVQNAWET